MDHVTAALVALTKARQNPRLDPNLNVFPLPPLWMTRAPTPWSWYAAPDPHLYLGNQTNPGIFNPPENPGFGASGWNYGQGNRPGNRGDLFIGKKRAPLTGGWVYGIENWYPQEQDYLPPRKV